MALRTIGLGVTLALGVLGGLPASEAQQPTKVPRVGVLWPISDDPVLEAFPQSVFILADTLIE